MVERMRGSFVVRKLDKEGTGWVAQLVVAAKAVAEHKSTLLGTRREGPVLCFALNIVYLPHRDVREPKPLTAMLLQQMLWESWKVTSPLGWHWCGGLVRW